MIVVELVNRGRLAIAVVVLVVRVGVDLEAGGALPRDGHDALDVGKVAAVVNRFICFVIKIILAQICGRSIWTGQHFAAMLL